jgi:putative transposase
MQSLKQGVARRLALRAGDSFWQARYYDFNVWSGRKFVEKLRYIYRNPAKRGLVARPEENLLLPVSRKAALSLPTVEPDL